MHFKIFTTEVYTPYAFPNLAFWNIDMRAYKMSREPKCGESLRPQQSTVVLQMYLP